MNTCVQPQLNPFELYCSLDYFKGLDPFILQSLADISSVHHYGLGQIAFLDGEICTGLHIVQSGWLKGFKHTILGREQVIRFVGPGDVINEIGILGNGKNPVTLSALEPCKVWIIQRETLLNLMDIYPALCKLISQNLAKQVYKLMYLIEDLSIRTVEARLARLLVEQSQNKVVIRQQWFTQDEIAARLGTVKGVINRILRKFVEQGYICIDRYQIKLENYEALKRIALLMD